MIVIKSIETFETDRDPEQILIETLENRLDLVFLPNEEQPIEVDSYKELIKGIKFVRPDGKEIIIGCSKQAQGVVGIQYEAWKEQENLYNNLYKRYLEEKKTNDRISASMVILKHEYLKLENMGFLESLKWAFRKLI